MDKLLNHQADKIERTLAAQGLDIRVVGGTVGPRLIVFHAVKPAAVKLSAIMRMDEEIALGLGASTCRIARDGRYLKIEIPRRDPETVHLLQLTDRVPNKRGMAVVGVDEEGTPLLLPLDSPNVGHVLIAGTTGSGKTALARAMIAGLVMSHSVCELSLVLIDPKRRGYAPFGGLPHLAYPIVNEPAEAVGLLAWGVKEMVRRDREGGARAKRGHHPRLVFFIDELADLMLATSDDAEEHLARLVQRGREAGLHIVACTQKPTAGIIGSLVKANFPVRIVGKVTDYQEALNAAGRKGTGAEYLLGRGDFLVVANRVTRMQGAYIDESEISDLVVKLRGGRPVSETSRGNDTTGESVRGKILNFVERYRDHRNGRGEHDGRGGHNKKPPTEAMIEFALAELAEHGEVTQAAIRDFHKRRYGTDCNPRRARATIEKATERLNGNNEGVSDG